MYLHHESLCSDYSFDFIWSCNSVCSAENIGFTENNAKFNKFLNSSSNGYGSDLIDNLYILFRFLSSGVPLTRFTGSDFSLTLGQSM